MPYFPHIQPDNASRRSFLQRASALSVMGSAAPWALSLSAMADAAAAGASDYKALVCVFLYGGNDYANTVVPYDQASYDAQYALRGNLRIDRNALTPNLLNPATPLAVVFTAPVPVMSAAARCSFSMSCGASSSIW